MKCLFVGTQDNMFGLFTGAIKYNSDGMVRTLFHSRHVRPYDLALDSFSRKLYYTNVINNTIEYINLQPTSLRVRKSQVQ